MIILITLLLMPLAFSQGKLKLEKCMKGVGKFLNRERVVWSFHRGRYGWCTGLRCVEHSNVGNQYMFTRITFSTLL